MDGRSLLYGSRFIYDICYMYCLLIYEQEVRYKETDPLNFNEIPHKTIYYSMKSEQNLNASRLLIVGL